MRYVPLFLSNAGALQQFGSFHAYTLSPGALRRFRDYYDANVGLRWIQLPPEPNPFGILGPRVLYGGAFATKRYVYSQFAGSWYRYDIVLNTPAALLGRDLPEEVVPPPLPLKPKWGMIPFAPIGGFGAAAGEAAALGEAEVGCSSAARAGSAANNLRPGSFSVRDWNGYPTGAVPKPRGPFRLLEGAEYDAARKAANQANAALRRANPAKYAGKQIHEIQPVKYGGSPTDPANKIALTPEDHAKYTSFWNRFQRGLQQ